MLYDFGLRSSVLSLLVMVTCFLNVVQEPNVLGQESSSQAATPSEKQEGEKQTKVDEAANKNDKHGDPAADELVIKAHFLSAAEHPIVSRPEEWTGELRVDSCVGHGVRVKQGEVLVRLQSRQLEHAIQDQQQSVVSARLAAQKGRQELELLRKSTRMAVAESEQAERIATEDLKRFVTMERDQRNENLHLSLKNAQDYLAYQEEELKQLVKMYEADDLTEETEEIVLRRTRDDVERSRQSMIRSQQQLEKGVQVVLPRSQEQLENTLKKAVLALEKSATSARTEIAEKEASVDKLDRDLMRAVEHLSRLQADQQWLTLKAPISGMTYLGEPRFGAWPDPTPLAANLKPGSIVKPSHVFVTVADPVVDRAVATIDEKDLPYVTPGRRGALSVSALPELESDATVAEISSVPVGDGKFLVTFQTNLPHATERLVPGMTCEITFAKNMNDAAAK